LFQTAPKIVRSAVREIRMIAEPKRKPHQDDNDRDNRERRHRDKRERRHQEKALDEALKNTFPASDPVSVETAGPARRRPPGKDLKDDKRVLTNRA
jgi:hypothetical protein